MFCSICLVGSRLVTQVGNCTKDPTEGAELWNQFCERRVNASHLFQNETTEADYECDEYFHDNNVTFSRGIRGISSGVLMENIKNTYMNPGLVISNSKNETEYNLGGKDPRNYVLVDKFTSFTILIGIFFPSVTGNMKLYFD